MDDGDNPDGHHDDIPHVRGVRRQSMELHDDKPHDVVRAHDELVRHMSDHHRDVMELQLQRRLKLRKLRLNSCFYLKLNCGTGMICTVNCALLYSENSSSFVSAKNQFFFTPKIFHHIKLFHTLIVNF